MNENKKGRKKKSKGPVTKPPILAENSVEDVEIFEDAVEGNDNEVQEYPRLSSLNLSVQGADFPNSDSSTSRDKVDVTEVDLSNLSLTNSSNVNKIKKDNYQSDFVNITQPFLEATKGLAQGELLHDPWFGLFEAMSAIEMMDPKMDAGMMCNKGKRKIMNFEQSVEAGKLKLNDFTHEENIGIMDTTLCCLITWLEGHSLAQTVFTNLYLHSPLSVQDKNLGTFCIAMLKLVDVIEEIVTKAGVFEEEDFQPSVYGYNLATNVTEAKATSMLRECEDELQKRIKSLAGTQGKSQAEILRTNEEVDKLNAVLARLKFIKFLYLLLLHLLKKDNLAECPRLIALCSESLSSFQKSSSLGIRRSSDETEPFLLGFELLVNQRLLPPTFPRSTRIKSLDETFSFFEGLLQRIKTILKITSLQNFHSILEFFTTFSESQPCVLSRSFLQLLYAPMRFKKPSLEDMINSMKESVRTFSAPPVLMSKVPQQLNKEVGECVEMFFDRCAPVFAALLVVCGHNRARQRDKLAHILDDFASLQIETERMDGYIHTLCLGMDGVRQHTNCFGNWLLYHISKVMIHYVLTGFELELYSVHEFGYIYWYLYEFLYGWLLSSLSRAETFMAESDATADKSNKKGSKHKNKTNPKRTKSYTKEICVTQAQQHLAGGFFKAMMGLTIDNKIQFPNKEFDDEGVRYRHRFQAFNTMRTPSPVHYIQYKNICDSLSLQQPSAKMYSDSSRNFQQAKTYLEAIPNPEKDVLDLLKVAKTNLVVVKLLASGHTRDSTVPPELDFSSHMHFPILKVK